MLFRILNNSGDVAILSFVLHDIFVIKKYIYIFLAIANQSVLKHKNKIFHSAWNETAIFKHILLSNISWKQTFTIIVEGITFKE